MEFEEDFNDFNDFDFNDFDFNGFGISANETDEKIVETGDNYEDENDFEDEHDDALDPKHNEQLKQYYVLASLINKTHTLTEFVAAFNAEDGFNVNGEQRAGGKSLLFKALRRGRSDIARFLVENGADVSISCRMWKWLRSSYYYRDAKKKINKNEAVLPALVFLEKMDFDVNEERNIHPTSFKYYLDSTLLSSAITSHCDAACVQHLLDIGADPMFFQYEENLSREFSTHQIAVLYDAPLPIIDALAHRTGESTRLAMANFACMLVGNGWLSNHVKSDRVKSLLKTIAQDPENEAVLDKQRFESSVISLVDNNEEGGGGDLQSVLQFVVESVPALFTQSMFPYITQYETLHSLYTQQSLKGRENLRCDVNMRGEDGYTALSRVVMSDNVYEKTLTFLLGTLHADPNIVLPDSMTPLMWTCLLNTSTRTMELLLEHGADVRPWNKFHENVVMHAAQFGPVDKMKMLVKYSGASIVLSIRHPVTKLTALEVANKMNRVEMVNYLLKL